MLPQDTICFMNQFKCSALVSCLHKRIVCLEVPFKSLKHTYELQHTSFKLTTWNLFWKKYIYMHPLKITHLAEIPYPVLLHVHEYIWINLPLRYETHSSFNSKFSTFQRNTRDSLIYLHVLLFCLLNGMQACLSETYLKG